MLRVDLLGQPNSNLVGDMAVFQKLRDTLKDLPVHGIIADVVKDGGAYG
jgi:hypothetical protein